MQKTHTLLITGAASGIGAGIASQLAEAGRHVIVSDLDLEAAEMVERAHRRERPDVGLQPGDLVALVVLEHVVGKLALGAEALVGYLDQAGQAEEQGIASPQEELEAWLAAQDWAPADDGAALTAPLQGLDLRPETGSRKVRVVRAWAPGGAVRMGEAMAERARCLGGELKIISHPGAGWALALNIALEA